MITLGHHHFLKITLRLLHFLLNFVSKGTSHNLLLVLDCLSLLSSFIELQIFDSQILLNNFIKLQIYLESNAIFCLSTD